MNQSKATDSQVVTASSTAYLPRRASGVLLHPTSLPGRFGIGCLGREALDFVDVLAAAGQSYWQILPLGPTDEDGSPYSSYCSMAGNPLLVDLQSLVEEGDLEQAELNDAPSPSGDSVDYSWLFPWKRALMATAARRFLHRSGGERGSLFASFCREQDDWLDDYALFMAIREHCKVQARASQTPAAAWHACWDPATARREPAALARWSGLLSEQIEIYKVWQFYFFRQWQAIRRHANQRGIVIVGDVPIFVAAESVDVWMAPEQFLLDEQLRPTHVAGVPPDYFSQTGQRWGNPLYDWQVMADNDFAWWKQRFRSLLGMVDVIRVDHFRGFEACWSIPASEPTAVVGRWEPAPGRELFASLARSLGPLPILAEDLGLITPEVEALRDELGFPGMRVLQFGLEGIDPSNLHVPENHIENSVVYTGTHDNDTTLGWYRSLTAKQKQAITRHLGYKLDDPAWQLMRIVMDSPGRVAIVPLQDIFRLGSEARMNTPGTTSGNWQWRWTARPTDSEALQQYAGLTDQAGRAHVGG